ncbi:glyoxylate/hydroxypyruvate reductase A-like [Convolutriloba macropyga]|uniref:glyoxylate/hydroxypyruvate reductase A-like n=1 Tax=Convolutriloba macropyga TaxID=536237 RepID=UPI003F5228BA
MMEQITVGFLGVGDIGSGIAEVCKLLGMRCIGYAGSVRKIKHFDRVYAEDPSPLLLQSDYIVNSLPHSDRTSGLLSSPRLKIASPKSPVLINVGRGSIIDEASLIEALDKGWISLAILDVFENEPLPQSSPLWTHPRAVITPHNSAGAIDQNTHIVTTAAFAENLELIEAGITPNLLVDYSRGY